MTVADVETVTYLGCLIDIGVWGFRVHAPNGDTALFATMTSARRWARWHRRTLRDGR